jgi:hypothetical protein
MFNKDSMFYSHCAWGVLDIDHYTVLHFDVVHYSISIDQSWGLNSRKKEKYSDSSVAGVGNSTKLLVAENICIAVNLAHRFPL